MKTMRTSLLTAALAAVALAACEPPAAKAPPPPPAGGPAASAPPAAGSAAPDALGEKPALPPPRAFTPPAPVVFEAANGIKVWLLARPALPIVSVALAIPAGSASDPPKSAGLAYITADMLDEGAGSRDAVALSSAVNDLGATLSLGARPDGSFATLTVLKKNFPAAFSIFADVIARPRFDAKEWKRVSDLWQNDLKKRGDDPALVSSLVSHAALYGPGTAYGHPAAGLLSDAKGIGLGAVKSFYRSAWRPDRAVLVVAGAVTREEVTQAIEKELGGWKAPRAAAEAPVVPKRDPSWKPPRLVLVDRPGAPQSAIAVVREGVAASDPRAPLLSLINTALGGSFTSRLNQNLREEHGWSYGARTAFSESRGQGLFMARAAVITEATGPALKETLGELSKMADSGLTQEELAKVLAQDRADQIETYETVGGAAQRLATLAWLGLPPTFDATASQARQKVTMAGLAELSSAVDPKGATVVVVGPRDKVAPQLEALGLGAPQLWDVEGRPQ
ncbi:MAG: insulinase family protein [Polyangiaceae bacterium]|nr:insulinase family protein [Polyangiaceae bacterium]